MSRLILERPKSQINACPLSEMRTFELCTERQAEG